MFAETLRDERGTHATSRQMSGREQLRFEASSNNRQGALRGRVVASGSTLMSVAPRATNATADGVLSGHIRALMAPQPIDVASSDRHTVKPWFNGRIPEAPRVVDLVRDGYPLVGGRLDVIAQTPVPTLSRLVLAAAAIRATKGSMAS